MLIMVALVMGSFASAAKLWHFSLHLVYTVNGLLGSICCSNSLGFSFCMGMVILAYQAMTWSNIFLWAIFCKAQMCIFQFSQVVFMNCLLELVATTHNNNGAIFTVLQQDHIYGMPMPLPYDTQWLQQGDMGSHQDPKVEQGAPIVCDTNSWVHQDPKISGMPAVV